MTVMLSRDEDYNSVDEGVNSNLLNVIDNLPETNVPVSSLVPGFHLRQDGTSAAHVRLLADAAGSVRLPSILVQKRGLRIIDGMHRVEVAKLRSEWVINARIVDCTDEQALVLAVRSNTLHGLPLTRSDRISSAKRILTAHPDWSDRAVAGITGLSAKAIASIRNSSAGDMQFTGKRLGRDGKRRPVMPGEGRLRAAEYIRTHPEASLREVSRETDVSLGTVHDVRDKLRREEADDSPRAEPCPAVPPAHQVRPLLHPAGTSIHRIPRSCKPAGFAWSEVSVKLTRDPAIRYTEGGRAFLRWMAVHSMQADEWQEFIDAIPQRWLEDVHKIATSMSEEWQQFAERLGQNMSFSNIIG
jgi:hypothetical protein